MNAPLQPPHPLEPDADLPRLGKCDTGRVISQRDVALRLDIPLEMAKRHGIPARMSDEEFAQLESDAPAWLVQSRANRTGKRPVWVELTCTVCGCTETVRPKKWWPSFTYLSCEEHDYFDLPVVADGMRRDETPGIASRFIGVVDSPREGEKD